MDRDGVEDALAGAPQSSHSVTGRRTSSGSPRRCGRSRSGTRRSAWARIIAAAIPFAAPLATAAVRFPRWPARPTDVSMDEIVALCKRRGFIFPSSEIYGGLGSTYDYGHYGVLLKNNVKAEWWRAMLQDRDDIVALDSAIIQHPQVWEASGHLEGFTDPLVQCLGKCKQRWREDHLREARRGRRRRPGAELRCPRMRRRALRAAPVQPDVRDPRRPGRRARARRSTCARRPRRASSSTSRTCSVRAQEAAVRDRPDRQVVPQRDHARQLHLPHPRVRADGDGVLRPARRRRAVAPSTGWSERERWYTELGIRPDYLRIRAHDADELSHYSRATSDVEYLFPIGWSELEGIANRGDFDLTQHAKFCGEKLEYFDQGTQRALRPARDRAGRRRRPRHARLPGRRLRRRGGRGARSAPCCACTRASRRSRSPSCRWSTRRECRRRPARSSRSCAAACQPSTTRAARSASATAARTRSAPPGASPSTARRLEDDTVTLRDRDSLEQVRVPIDGLADDLSARLAQPWRTPKLD